MLLFTRNTSLLHKTFTALILYMLSFVLFIRSWLNRMGGVIVTVLASNLVDRGFEPGSGQTKDYEIVFVDSPLSTHR